MLTVYIFFAKFILNFHLLGFVIEYLLLRNSCTLSPQLYIARCYLSWKFTDNKQSILAIFSENSFKTSQAFLSD